MQPVTILVPFLCFLPLFGVRFVSTAVIVSTVGVVLEIVGKYLSARAISWIKARSPKMVFIPVQEIGHAIEKTVASFVLVCGESLLGTLLDPRYLPCAEGCTAVAYVVKMADEIGLCE